MQPASYGEAFLDNPTYVVLAIFLGALGLFFTIIAIVMTKRGSPGTSVVGMLAMAFGVAAALTGLFGALRVKSHADSVLQAKSLSDADRGRLRASAAAEASYQWKTGAGAALVPFLGGFVCAVAGRGKKRR